MQVAAYAPSSPPPSMSPPVPASTGEPLPPGVEPPPADAPPEVQSGFRRFAKLAPLVRSLPGITGSMYRSSQPDVITIRAQGAGWLKMAENILEDSVEGARLVLEQRGDDGTGTPPPDGRLPFWEHPAELAKAVAGMPGVTFSYVGPLYPGGEAVALFVAPDDAQRAILDGLVRDTLGGVETLWVAKKPW